MRAAKPYRPGSLGLNTEDLMPLLDAAEGFIPADAAAARQFFETHCQPFAIRLAENRRGFQCRLEPLGFGKLGVEGIGHLFVALQDGVAVGGR